MHPSTSSPAHPARSVRLKALAAFLAVIAIILCALTIPALADSGPSNPAGDATASSAADEPGAELPAPLATDNSADSQKTPGDTSGESSGSDQAAEGEFPGKAENAADDSADSSLDSSESQPSADEPSADEATAEGVAPLAASPREADITNKLNIDSVKLQRKLGDGTWQDVLPGTHLTSGAYVRVYIDWSIADMSTAEEGSTFTITIDGKDHLLASDFGPAPLVDNGRTIGTYVVNGNRDATDPPQAITIVTTLSAEGSQFPSLENGFFSLEGYVRGTGDDIVFTVNGTALPSISIDPPTTGPLPGTPLLKYGSQVAGQNQIVWSMGVNLDNVKNAYAAYAAGNPTPSPKQGKLLLTDELQGGQTITSSGIVVYLPVLATTDDGVAQTEQYAAYPITDLFAQAEGSSSGGMTQEQFAANVRDATQPTIGVWEGHVVYIGFGDVPTGNGSSALNMGKILNGQGDLGLSQLLTQKNVTPQQRDIIMDYLATYGSNKGDFTSFIVELRADASESGQYQNTATLTYGDSSTETSTGGASFSVISGGVEVRDGKATLKKVDADDPAVTLSGAVFKLEKMQPDNSWQVVAGSERLTTSADGLISVTGLMLGQYRFVEVEAPAGYELETSPIGFTIASSTPGHAVSLEAQNIKSPVLRDVQLVKRDAADPSIVLPNAIFKLEQQLGDGTWAPVDGQEYRITNPDGVITVTGLVVGTYRFVELEAPDGYVLNDTPVQFTVTDEGTDMLTVTADNQKSPVLVDAKLVKRDADDPTLVLPGAVLKLEQQAGDGSWTDKEGYERLITDINGAVEVKGLPEGTYRFVEVEAPDGYMLGGQPIPFEITEGSPALIELALGNQKSPVLRDVQLTKRDAENAAMVLPGAVFQLEQQATDGTWAVMGGFDRLTTDVNGMLEAKNLPVGTYRFVEVEAPDGYILEDQPIPFEVTADSTAVILLTADNQKSPVLRDVSLVKRDADNPDVLLSGAVFKLEHALADGTWAIVDGFGHMVTDANGVVEAKGLPVGSYRFVELEAPDGYLLGGQPLPFEVTADESTAISLSADNQKSPVFRDVRLVKKDAEDASILLAGAVFQLEQRATDGSWSTLDGYDRLITNDQGVIEVKGLAFGSYRFVEVEAPEGYVLDETPVSFEVGTTSTGAIELAMDNVQLPPDPVDPVDPVDPTDPTTPSPNKPTPPSWQRPMAPYGTGTTASSANLVRTSDSAPLWALGGIAALALAAGAVTVTAVIVRRHRRP